MQAWYPRSTFGMTINQELGLSKNGIISAYARIKSEVLHYSKAALKDELLYQLSSTARMNWDTFELANKYHELAEFVLYRINTWNPAKPPVFVINTSDLTQSLRNELERLQKTDAKGFDKIVTEAVQTIMEGINMRYYHVAALPYKVTWRFEP
jgi:hypothetical protein